MAKWLTHHHIRQIAAHAVVLMVDGHQKPSSAEVMCRTGSSKHGFDFFFRHTIGEALSLKRILEIRAFPHIIHYFPLFRPSPRKIV